MMSQDTQIVQQEPVPVATSRKRTFYYSWCNMTEVDYVCLKCQAVMVDGACIHCARKQEKKEEALKTLSVKVKEMTQDEKRAYWKIQGAAYRARKKEKKKKQTALQLKSQPQQTMTLVVPKKVKKKKKEK